MDETFEIIKAGAADAPPERALYRIQQTYPDGSGGSRWSDNMENVTANQARLYDNIEAGLHLVAPLIDRLENHYDCDDGLYLARATLGKALASLELLRHAWHPEPDTVEEARL